MKADEPGDDVQARREEQADLELGGAIRKVMATPEGQDFVFWLVYSDEMGGLTSGIVDFSIREGEALKLHTFLREGRRDLALDLQNKLQELVPGDWARMVSRAAERQLKDLIIANQAGKTQKA